jgi:hypothetical protein
VSLAGSQFGCGGHRELATDRFLGVFHIGEDAAKTNAVYALPRSGEARLLPVALEHLVAGRGYLGAILLQAGQDDEIALIDHGTAETLHVARTGFLFLRRTAALSLGKGFGGSGKRQQSKSQESYTHRSPSF